MISIESERFARLTNLHKISIPSVIYTLYFSIAIIFLYQVKFKLFYLYIYRYVHLNIRFIKMN